MLVFFLLFYPWTRKKNSKKKIHTSFSRQVDFTKSATHKFTRLTKSTVYHFVGKTFADPCMLFINSNKTAKQQQKQKKNNCLFWRESQREIAKCEKGTKILLIDIHYIPFSGSTKWIQAVELKWYKRYGRCIKAASTAITLGARYVCITSTGYNVIRDGIYGACYHRRPVLGARTTRETKTLENEIAISGLFQATVWFPEQRFTFEVFVVRPSSLHAPTSYHIQIIIIVG